MIYPTPTLLLDERKCRANIAKMAAKAAKHNLIFRPHFKTHQSLALGRWFQEVGVSRITVSSLTMAEYFAREWQDITVAFPVNILELATINRLAAKITLNLLVESPETARFLADNLHHSVGLFIKVDVGYHRTGVGDDDTATLDSILEIAEKCTKLRFQGFLTHAGHTYGTSSPQQVQTIHTQAREALCRLKDRFRQRFPELLVSVGDTPGCSLARDFTGIDEIRPGNFVFYDLMQHLLGACTADEIAVALSCPVVAVHPGRGEAVLYGGAIHLSKERVNHPDFGPIYGQVVRKTDNGWGELVPGMYLKSLSQEHGVVAVPPRELADIQLGQCLLVIPIHSCLAVSLMRSYSGLASSETFTTL